MSEMFNNYPQPDDYIPNNHPRHCKKHELEIMSGETTTHTFEIPFNVNEETIDFKIIYKLGLNIVLTKHKTDVDIVIDEDNDSIISCVISAIETLAFRSTVLDAHVQIEFTMKDGTTQMSEIYKVKLRDSLDVNNTPAPGVIAGIGYTED